MEFRKFPLEISSPLQNSAVLKIGGQKISIENSVGNFISPPKFCSPKNWPTEIPTEKSVGGRRNPSECNQR